MIVKEEILVQVHLIGYILAKFSLIFPTTADRERRAKQRQSPKRSEEGNSITTSSFPKRISSPCGTTLSPKSRNTSPT